jgi:hypothetical protein
MEGKRECDGGMQRESDERKMQKESNRQKMEESCRLVQKEPVA